MSRSSSRGFHYYQLHKKCPWKFYIQHIQGYESVKKGKALIGGIAFHEGKETFYRTWNKQQALDTVYDSLEAQYPECQSDDIYDELYSRVPTMLESWINEYGDKDQITYKIIEVEHELDVPIENTSYSHTMRIDCVAQIQGTNSMVILETKTSSFSVGQTIQNVTMGDQATAYIWGLKKMHPDWNVVGVIPDVTYWNSKSKNPEKIQNTRGSLVTRSKRSLQEYEEGLAYEISDISAKTDAVRKGLFKPSEAFVRHTHICYEFFKPCQFSYICRDFDFKNGFTPMGLQKVDTKNLSIMDECDE